MRNFLKNFFIPMAFVLTISSIYCISEENDKSANLSQEDMEIIQNLEVLQELELLKDIDLIENYETIKDMENLEPKEETDEKDKN